MRDESKRNLRVGLLVAAALAVLAVAILTIGKRQQLFSRHTRYRTTFRHVSGLQAGAPVSLNGVTVGFVEWIHLPVDPSQERITVRFTVDKEYTERIRADTEVSIKTIGLLGDKFLEVRGGSADEKRILEGGVVRGRDPAEMAEFVARGEDVMENLIAISSSLRVILRRVEAGEGVIGELTVAPEEGGRLIDSLHQAIAAIRLILDRVQAGEGLLGRLMADDELARSVLGDVSGATRAVEEMATTISTDLQREDTVYAALLRDPEGSRLVVETVRTIQEGAEALAAAAEELATGEGTLPRLMQDEEYAGEFLEDLHGLIHSLRSAADKLDQGEGTAGAMINDPQLYQDLENVVRGVKSSKVVSWFIRNRRKKGEKVLAKEEARRQEAEAASGP